MKLATCFKTDTRNDGTEFVTRTDDAPEWLAEAIYEAHAGTGPNDWIYAECKAACEAIDSGELASDDDLHAYADGRVEIYTKELFQWLADMCLTDLYAQAEEQAEETQGEKATLVQRVSAIQYHAIEHIARTMLEAWEANREDADE